MENKVWVVSYCDRDMIPQVIVFDNEKAARKCFNAYGYVLNYKRVNMDEYTVHHKFNEIAE